MVLSSCPDLGKKSDSKSGSKSDSMETERDGHENRFLSSCFTVSNFRFCPVSDSQIHFEIDTLWLVAEWAARAQKVKLGMQANQAPTALVYSSSIMTY